MNMTAMLLILTGLFAISGAGFDWDWFMENHKARFMSELLGSRTRGRIFYLILGVGIAPIGFLGIFRIIEM